MGKVFFPVLATAILLLCANVAQACSCEEFGRKSYGKLIAHEYDRRAAAVFSGEVTELSASRVTLRVERLWKGALSEEVTLPHGGSSCFFGFRLGEAYLVYAYAQEEGLKTDICTQTKRLAEAGKDIPILDKLSRKKAEQEERRKVRNK